MRSFLLVALGLLLAAASVFAAPVTVGDFERRSSSSANALIFTRNDEGPFTNLFFAKKDIPKKHYEKIWQSIQSIHDEQPVSGALSAHVAHWRKNDNGHSGQHLVTVAYFGGEKPDARDFIKKTNVAVHLPRRHNTI